MRLTPLAWGLRAPITPRLGGNCWGSGTKIRPCPKIGTKPIPALQQNGYAYQVDLLFAYKTHQCVARSSVTLH